MNRLFGALAAAFALVASAEAAPLTGQTLEATSSNAAFPVSPGTAVVGAGAEFTTAIGFTTFEIDIDENGLVTVTYLGPGGLTHGAEQTITLFDINGTIEEIIGFELISTSGVTGLVQSDLIFGPDSVAMQLGLGTQWQPGHFFTAQIRFAEIPVPAALPLFLAGLGAIGFARRRARKEQAAA